MEEKFTRRQVLQTSAGVLLSAAAGSAFIFSRENAQAAIRGMAGTPTPLASASEYNFFLSSTSLSRFSPATNTLSKTAALTYTAPNVKDNTDPWPALTLNNLEAWTQSHGCAACGGTLTPAAATSNNAATFIDHVMNTRVNAAFDVADITTQLGQSSVNTALNFFYHQSNQGIPGTSSLAAASTIQSSRSSLLANAAPPSVELFGIKVQFRGPDFHPLGKCVRQNVRHFNIDIFQNIGNGRYKYIHNYHLGAYRDAGKLCFVVFDNVVKPPFCWKICNPTQNDLVSMFKWMLLAALAIAGIALAIWLLSLITEALAAVAFAALVALA